MATIRKLRDKWQVIIRRKNYPNISKVFIQKSLANKGKRNGVSYGKGAV